MRQLTSLDAQFLNVESPTTVGHVGSLVVLDPSTAPDGQWTLETVRAVFEPRLHLAALRLPTSVTLRMRAAVHGDGRRATLRDRGPHSRA